MPRTHSRHRAPPGPGPDAPATSGPDAAPATGGRGPRWRAALAWGAAGATALALLLRLAPQAARAVLNTDECFHAHVARWIAAHGSLPDRIPELYGGLFYSYPPLLHVLGAAWVKVLGATSLPLLNVALYAALMGALTLIPVPGLAGAPRRWALWLVIANATLAAYAVRFYAEMLTCLLGLLVAVLLLRLAATRRVRDGALLGVAAGFTLLAKNTALVVPALLASYVLVQAAGRRRDAVRAGLVALGVALAIAAPMWLRNQVLFGSPVYPGLARDIDPWIYSLNRAAFAGTLSSYLAGVRQTIGPWLLGWGALAVLVAIGTGRRDVHAGLLACSAAGLMIVPLSPLHDPRHVMPVVALIALSGAVVLHGALRGRPRVSRALEAGLAALALVAVVTLGERRAGFDVAPHLLEGYAAIRERVPAGRRVLSPWTYDTFYYTDRPADWPIPWGQGVRSPASLFREQDPGRFLAELDRLGIEWILMSRGPGSARFNGVNYPRSFVSCVTALADRGALQVAWGSPRLVLVRRVQ